MGQITSYFRRRSVSTSQEEPQSLKDLKTVAPELLAVLKVTQAALREVNTREQLEITSLPEVRQVRDYAVPDGLWSNNLEYERLLSRAHNASTQVARKYSPERYALLSKLVEQVRSLPVHPQVGSLVENLQCRANEYRPGREEDAVPAIGDETSLDNLVRKLERPLIYPTTVPAVKLTDDQWRVQVMLLRQLYDDYLSSRQKIYFASGDLRTRLEADCDRYYERWKAVLHYLSLDSKRAIQLSP